MKHAKKCMVLLLVLAMLVSFGGCKKSDDTGKSTNGSNTTDTQKGDDKEAVKTYNGQDVSKPVELVLYYIGDVYKDQDKVMEEINKILKDQINATITLKNIALSDYTTKYALTIAGGEKMDLIYTSSWAYYQTEATKGAFAEVTDQVLTDYMPLTKANQSEASFGQAKIDGKVYFIPNNMSNVNANAIVIRGDLREKYGLDKLQTIEDLTTYYQAIANDKESGVTFPYAAAQNNDLGKLIFYFANNDFVQIAGNVQNYFTYKYSDNVSSSDIFWIYDTEEYLAYAKLMKEWADKGFWSKSSIANATDVKESFINGTSASYIQNLGTVGATASQVTGTHPEWKPEVVDLTPDANRFLGAYTGDGIAVLANSENKERAFMAVDLLKFNEDLYNLARHGIEGVHYSKVGDDYWKAEANNDNWPFGNAVSWGFKNNMYERTREDTFPDQVAISDQWKAKEKESPTAAFSFDDTNVKTEMANLQNVYIQYVPLLDLGLVDDVEGTIAKFQEQAERAGMQKIMDEVKTQLDAFFAR